MSLGFSVIMQSYLDIYNSSRKDPEQKFIRSVNSFLNQKHKNNELIIVSDDCDITEKIYLENFKEIKNIKYVRVENKERKRMYHQDEKGRFFRGSPRSAGQDIATKDVIAYMDSDDIILPDHLLNIEKGWSIHDYNLFCSWNSYEMLPLEIVAPGISNENFSQLLSSKMIVNLKSYFGFDKFYVAVSPNPIMSRKPGYNTRSSTQINFHLKSVKTRWRDTYGISEDVIFSEELGKEAVSTGGVVTTVNSPTYVFCHRDWSGVEGSNFNHYVWDY